MFKKNILALFILLILPLALSFTANASEGKFEENSLLPKGQIVNKDYFTVGRNVTVSGTVNGDAYIAGGQVVIDGDINGDLLAAGGIVIISGKVLGNVRVAGGDININGIISGNFSAFAGRVLVNTSSKIERNLVVGGGSVSVLGVVGKNATIASGQTTLSNSIGGDVAIYGPVTLTSAAKVSGGLTYWDIQNAVTQPGATISGSVLHNIPVKPVMREEAKDNTRNANFAGFVFTLKLIDVLAVFLVGLILLKVFPLFSKGVVRYISEKPLESLGLGVIALILIPIIIFVSFATIIGIPLSVVLFAVFVSYIYAVRIFVSQFLGAKILRMLNKEVSIYVQFAIGLIVFTLLSFVPIVGWLVTAILGVVGIGAILLETRSLYTRLRLVDLI